ncbi:metallopeptidase family protein [Marivita hallyeonensis]|uniref:Predicted Zn-dependent protease, minimal metalloprotease (MMP)-like domain n=1 Tax=Marivita hallyeonensis TaxID=996342 RepID=A0A1M5MTX3_9RHOB|nr:metallopeptidase family protein [Marivita hallyeonensis]SHG80721.1 Predicted Zn-dependent protease, minimal metalloprotease (MMP)-like domain [Marivita hallyeonensis]
MDVTTDIDDITRYAEAAFNGLPQPFRDLCQDVLLQVIDWPDKDMLAELEIEDPLELTGLYDGVPLTQKSQVDPSPFPDTVWLFSEPILAEWRERNDNTLEELVHHIVIHEIAHHFGWTDDEIAEIDRWWE